MSRHTPQRIMEEQAALRRVATLVARGTSPLGVFRAVAGEMGQIMYADYTLVCRYQSGDTMVVVGSWSRDGDVEQAPAVGSRWSLELDSAGARVARSGRPARICYDRATAGIGLFARTHGCRSSTSCPITIKGRLWGAVTTLFPTPEPRPATSEECMLDFVELIGLAIANAESSEELAASRARVVAAADSARRRIERNLHDGAQQRLIACELQLRAAEAMIPPGCGELRQQLTHTAETLADVVEELREISRGLHPGILSRSGGIKSVLKALARRSAVPVELDVRADRRFAENVEVAIYYLVSEALANIAKHAHASEARVVLDVRDAAVHICVRDDGVGDAEIGRGSGLIGLKDRIEALGGEFQVTSSAGTGTALSAEIPTDRTAPAPDYADA